MNKVLKYGLAVLIVLLFFFRCKKDNNYVPYVYVDEYIYATDPAFFPLNAVTGYIYWQGGSKGLIIFRKGQNEFVAYDRHCTYKVEDGDQIKVDASGLLATDAACNTKFSMTDGSVNSGPATRPLKMYEVSFDGTVLHIYN